MISTSSLHQLLFKKNTFYTWLYITFRKLICMFFRCACFPKATPKTELAFVKVKSVSVLLFLCSHRLGPPEQDWLLSFEFHSQTLVYLRTEIREGLAALPPPSNGSQAVLLS